MVERRVWSCHLPLEEYHDMVSDQVSDYKDGGRYNCRDPATNRRIADPELCICHAKCSPFAEELPPLGPNFESIVDRQSEYLHRQGLLSGVSLLNKNKQPSRQRSHDELRDDDSDE